MDFRSATEKASKRILLKNTQSGVLPGSPPGPGEPFHPAGVPTRSSAEAGTPALHTNPGNPPWRGGGWHGPAGNVTSGVRVKNLPSVDSKKPLCLALHGGPGSLWPPTLVPGRKPAEPTTRFSIRTRVPTLKHPPRSPRFLLRAHSGRTPGTPTPLSGRTLLPRSPGSLRGPRGTCRSTNTPRPLFLARAFQRCQSRASPTDGRC